jgi:cobalt-zinc-cadmium efflux system membrane fusion protein
MKRNSILALGLTAVLVVGLLVVSGCGRSDTEADATPDAEGVATAHTHEVDGQTCFICDATKRDSGRLWCTEHACYEDRCWLCQPQLEDKSRLYCKEHSLYEDECFLCHPEILEEAGEAAHGTDSSDEHAGNQDSAGSDVLFCNEHQVPELECGICQPQRTAELLPGEELKVRFESDLSAKKAGLVSRKPEQSIAQPAMSAICEVRYNGNEMSQITPFASGIVRRVLLDVGSDVRGGEALVEIHSAEVASARAAFISAAVDVELKSLAYEREKDLTSQKISSVQALQEASASFRMAEIAHSTARQRLLNYGLSAKEIARTEQTQDTSAILRVRAPFDGTLVARDVVAGETVEPGDALFTLVDLSSMWLSLSVPGSTSSALAPGLVVEAVLDGSPAVAVAGQLTWVDSSIDKRSRLLRARAVVPNVDRRLKAGMFGEATVLTAPRADALSLPGAAVQRFEGNTYVFVKHMDDLYGLRRVELGPSLGDDIVAVTAGLQADEIVIVDGAFTAMSEFLKSRLGAGCVDD